MQRVTYSVARCITGAIAHLAAIADAVQDAQPSPQQRDDAATDLRHACRYLHAQAATAALSTQHSAL
ncbi:hypothetical protein, partial [Xanthomonas vasicola]|uniref:hypothetical protein n=1 Tax=Xanthomonas vasicola TaxID=56459 RepID=UPI001F290883